MTNIPGKHCQTAVGGAGRAVPPLARRSFSVGASRERDRTSVGQPHARNGTATILRRRREDHCRFLASPPTEVNTGQPWGSGACRRREQAFEHADRANHQLMGSATRGCALCSENAGTIRISGPTRQENTNDPISLSDGANVGVLPSPRKPPTRYKEFPTDLDDLRDDPSCLLLRWKRL